jgi:serine/threonine-protein kinase
VNRLFRLGILIALIVLIGSGTMAVRLILVEDREVDVPSLTGLSAVEATNRLQSVGLQARIDQVDSDQPEGVVLHQTVPAGERVGKGNIIVIKVSRGGALIQVPDVRGMEFAEAVRALDAMGLKMGNVLRVSDQLKPAATIIAQNPASPASILNSRMVELLVSEGKIGRTETVQVPDLRGQEESLARQIAEQSDLAVSRVIYLESNLVPLGSVVNTQPRAGVRVQSGASIILYVAKAVTKPPVQDTDDFAGQAEVVPPVQQPAVSVDTRPPATVVVPVVPVEEDPSQSQTDQPPALVPVITQPDVPQTPDDRKKAVIRYQAPPLSRPLPLKIEITDNDGMRVLRDQQASGGEYISLETPYSGSATVMVYLGGELVWQERYD